MSEGREVYVALLIQMYNPVKRVSSSVGREKKCKTYWWFSSRAGYVGYQRLVPAYHDRSTLPTPDI